MIVNDDGSKKKKGYSRKARTPMAAPGDIRANTPPRNGRLVYRTPSMSDVARMRLKRRYGR